MTYKQLKSIDNGIFAKLSTKFFNTLIFSTWFY